MPERLPRPCQDGCKEYTRLGTNHLVERLTCLKCGHFQTEALNDSAVYSPDVCPHDIVDHRGSSKSTQKTFCRQCQTFIDARPREEHLKAKDLSRKLLTASTTQQYLAKNVLEERVVDKDQMV